MCDSYHAGSPDVDPRDACHSLTEYVMNSDCNSDEGPFYCKYPDGFSQYFFDDDDAVDCLSGTVYTKNLCNGDTVKACGSSHPASCNNRIIGILCNGAASTAKQYCWSGCVSNGVCVSP